LGVYYIVKIKRERIDLNNSTLKVTLKRYNPYRHPTRTTEYGKRRLEMKIEEYVGMRIKISLPSCDVDGWLDIFEINEIGSTLSDYTERVEVMDLICEGEVAEKKEVANAIHLLEGTVELLKKLYKEVNE